jgi:tRNA (guanine37-N1)-methyltransferase
MPTVKVNTSEIFLIKSVMTERSEPSQLKMKSVKESDSILKSRGGTGGEEVETDLGTTTTPRPKLLIPPTCKGMTVLDRSAFSKEITVPSILLPGAELTKALSSLQPFLLRMKRFKAVQDYPNPNGEDRKRVYLNPERVSDLPELLKKIPELQVNADAVNSFSMDSLSFTYENWKWDQLMESILPDDQDKFGGFTIVGRLVHLNLKDYLLPYKNIIGEIILDNVPNVKTVVNKLTTIDNTFRNFKMEVVAGDSETVVKVKENRTEFEFDFATVYWNSRLSSEHERIVKGYLKEGDTLFDVFAGVGPFSVPAAKKKCTVYANDLNPHSFKWLCHNATKNKVREFLTAFNKDGKEFILQDISFVIRSALKANRVEANYHVTMNLPAMAVEFLKYFWNLLPESKEGDLKTTIEQLKLTVHVYCFIKALEGHSEKALQLVKDELMFDLPEDKIIEVFFVRNVAPNKDMYRVSFALPHEILSSTPPSSRKSENESCESRKRKLSESD